MSIPDEIMGHILQYCGLIDVVNQKQVSKKHYNTCQDVLKRQVRTFLTNGYNLGELYSLLSKECVLSGSTMLQLLYGEYYENSDLDIFVKDVLFTIDLGLF